MAEKIASINIWSDHDKFCINALLEQREIENPTMNRAGIYAQTPS